MSDLSIKEIGQRIYFIRGNRVMLDSDLAALYGTETKYINRAVRRNEQRFPDSFMFKLTAEESENLKSQSGTSSLASHGGRRKGPLVFTEYGVVMLSSVLSRERAIQVNIAVVQAFVRLRELTESHRDLAAKLNQLESKYDKQFKVIFDAVRRFMAAGSPALPKRIKGLGRG